MQQQQTNSNDSTSVQLLQQKVESLERHLDRLGESNRELTSKIVELIVTVKLENDSTNKMVSTLNRNQQTLVNRIWAIVGTVAISLILHGIDLIKR